MNILILNIAKEWLPFLPGIREDLDSNLNPKIGFPVQGFYVYLVP
jgi:hypothetical protein